jgi:hypothetical protein
MQPSIYLFIYLSIYLPTYVSSYLPIYLPTHPFAQSIYIQNPSEISEISQRRTCAYAQTSKHNGTEI